MNRKNALLSVYNKTGILEFAQELARLGGWRIFSSGGTAKVLEEAGIIVTDVAEITGRPAILDHRVVTLAPEIHGGLLATEDMLDELEALGYPYFDLVCVDLYPLQDEIRRNGATRESIIEKTDIGGPTMLRSAAKGRRIVIGDPADRIAVINWMKHGCRDEQNFREQLAAKAEKIVAEYCLASAQVTSDNKYVGIAGERVTECRYGENGYQTPAALYSTNSDDPLALDRFEVVEGAPPSYNNYGDIDRLLQTITHVAEVNWKNVGRNTGFNPCIAVGAKHGNACGAAVGIDRSMVLKNTMDGDPLAIFGGLVMVNFPITESLAEVLKGKMLDGVIAPSFDEGAIELLRRKKDKCRFIVNPALENLVGKFDTAPRFRYVRGGFLRQPNYVFVPNLRDDSIARHGYGTTAHESDMMLAWAVGSTSNSNTITLVNNSMLIGNGTGQQDRVGAANLAVDRAIRSGHESQLAGAVAYSDSFFPFTDGVQALINAGIKAIFSSSGSVNDQRIIDLCVQNNVVLYMIPDGIGRGFFGH